MERRDEKPHELIHRFEHGGKRYAVDVETCFCFECDAISWDVLEYYPHTTPNRIVHLLKDKHDPVEVGEVISELEWLRATNSIVPFTKLQDVPKLFTIETGLKTVSVVLPTDEGPAQRAQRRWFARQDAAIEAPKALEVGRAALALLLGRAGEQRELRFEILLGESLDPAPVVETLATEAFRQARVAGKTITVSVFQHTPSAIESHHLAVRLDFTTADRAAEYVRNLERSGEALAKLVKAANPGDEHVRGCAVLRPATPQFAEAVRALHEAGFQEIELDLDGSYVVTPDLDPAAMQSGLSETATYYADRLLNNDYFRLEPIASLFARIYHGLPSRRTDPSGVQALAVDTAGDIWPSVALMGHENLRLGSVLSGDLDDALMARFNDVGVTGTTECMVCWARHLCGGGPAAVHQSLSGSFREPHADWCAAQRDWMAAAVSAFNMLSSQGVHFTRIYQTLSRKGRPSIFQLARTALKMTVVMRPLAEADAPMLREWENWNEASYFLLHPAGAMLITSYNREMDAIYPQGTMQEMLLTSRRGDPLGLVRMQPDKWPGVHHAWLYLHREADYASTTVRNGFRELVKQVGQAQQVRRIVFHAAAYETALRDFFTACGLRHEGTQRDALYVHSAYHDVDIFTATVAEL